MTIRARALLLSALVIAPPVAASAGVQGGATCRTCKGVGLLPCPEHKARECDLERRVLHCSFVAGCPKCRGAGWLDCSACEALGAESELEARMEGEAERSKRLAKLDEEMGRPLRKAESEHFVLVFEVDSLKVGRRRLDSHELLHLYVDRLEALFELYVEVLAADPGDFDRKPRVMVWSTLEDQLVASKAFAGAESEQDARLYGADPVHSFPGGIKRLFKTDDAIHRRMVHNAAHLLMSCQDPAQWVGHIGGGWADAGVGHWFEDRIFASSETFCYRPGEAGGEIQGGKLRPAVRKMVAGGRAPDAEDVFGRATQHLPVAHHAIGFSYVDHLIARDPAKTNLLFQRLRSKVPSRDAIQELFGLRPQEFQREWEAWVLATYPAR